MSSASAMLEVAILQAGLDAVGADLVRLADPHPPSVRSRDMVRAQLALALRQVAVTEITAASRRLAAVGSLLAMTVQEPYPNWSPAEQALASSCDALLASDSLVSWSEGVRNAVESDRYMVGMQGPDWGGWRCSLPLLSELGLAAAQLQFQEQLTPQSPPGRRASPVDSSPSHSAESSAPAQVPGLSAAPAASPMPVAPSPSLHSMEAPAPASTPAWGAAWSELTFALTNGHTIEVCSSTGRAAVLSFEDLGFKDGRGKEAKPSKTWWILVALLRGGGELWWSTEKRCFVGSESSDGYREWQLTYTYGDKQKGNAFRTALTVVRQTLCDYFGIPDDPIPSLGWEVSGWKTQFKCNTDLHLEEDET